jgi:hypothetical protein
MFDFDSTVLAAGMDAFGEFVTWSPAAGAPQSVPAVFWDNAVETKFEGDTDVDQVTTYLSVRLSQMTGLPARGDGFTVRGLAYEASEVLPDGVGGARVRIRLANDAPLAATQLPPAPVAT